MAKQMVCARCGELGAPKKYTPGSVWMELILWILFFPIGIIYSLVRHGKRYTGCAFCGSQDLVPTNSPRGRDLLHFKKGTRTTDQEVHHA
jgi:hypothetical protein